VPSWPWLCTAALIYEAIAYIIPSFVVLSAAFNCPLILVMFIYFSD